MNYLQRDRKSKTRTVVIKIVSVCVVLLIAFFFFSSSLTNLLHSAQYGVAYAFGYYNDPVRPIAENAYIKSLETENEELKTLLGRKPEKDDRSLAVVLTRPPKTPFDSFIIDSGYDSGIQVDDYVYGEFDFLIGKVASVGTNTSVIKLFSSSGMKMDVLISSSTTPVVAEGRGNGNFYIKLPKNIDVYEGDPVVVPAFKSSLLGVIEKIDGGDGDAYSHLYFKLPVNVYSLRYVQIKKSSR